MMFVSKSDLILLIISESLELLFVPDLVGLLDACFPEGDSLIFVDQLS
jgi:hypothetical protein